jgi:hypothetical protein
MAKAKKAKTKKAKQAKPRPARKRSTRKALQRVGTAGALNATEAGDTAALVGGVKRKRKGKLTEEQKTDGRAYLRDHQNLKPKQSYSELKKLLHTNVGDTTLWRAFFSEIGRAISFSIAPFHLTGAVK